MNLIKCQQVESVFLSIHRACISPQGHVARSRGCSAGVKTIEPIPLQHSLIEQICALPVRYSFLRAKTGKTRKNKTPMYLVGG